MNTQISDITNMKLAHNVYFKLNDNSLESKQDLVNGCYQYLKDNPGIEFFAAGIIVEKNQREVNVRDWDVSLHIIFKDLKSHNLYQQAYDHHTFINKFKDNWAEVKVFDSYIN